MRPKSIVLFERLYLGAWVLSFLNTLLSYEALQSRVSQNPALGNSGQSYVLIGVAIGVLLPLILWYFVARRGSAVAKWITVVLVALGVLPFLLSLVQGNIPDGLSGAISAAVLLLRIVASVMLFRADTVTWFGEDDDLPVDPAQPVA